MTTASQNLEVLLLSIQKMVVVALLSRVVGSSAFKSGGRIRYHRTFVTENDLMRPVFTSICTSMVMSHSSRNNFRRCIHPSTHSSFACFGTTSSSGDQETKGLTVNELKARLREEGLPTSGLKAELIERLSAKDNADPSSNEKKVSTKQPQSSKRKFQINPNWKTEFNAKALEEEFDNMAKKEGFDEKLAYFANDDTFEDEFGDDDYDIDLDEDDDMDESDGDIPEFGQPNVQSMDERLAAARRDQTMGRVTVPKSLDKFSQDVSFDDLKKLGFRREANPFGNDETPRRAQFKVITGSMTCSGCGSGFQKEDELRPGFLPPEKFETQMKLSKIEEAQKLNERAELAEWSPEDEIEWLLRQNNDDSEGDAEDLSNLSIDEMAEKMGLDLNALSNKKVICKRCHQLQNFGSVEKKLRPGWTDEPTLSQEEFRKLLLPLRQKKAVILALVDLFDFSGSVLPELDRIAGDNPVILAANKADLLPSEMGQIRAENWVRRELEYVGVTSIANIGGAVRLVSCKTGFGVAAMMEKTRKLADEMECDIYIVGAANAGKSTLVNYLLAEADPERNRLKTGERRRAGNANKWKGSVTTSPLPGTTLQFIKIELGGGTNLYDTPGLLVPGCLTERLTPEELKIVVPKK